MMSEPTKKDFDLSALPGGKADREAMFDNMSAVDLAEALEQALDSMTEENYDGELVSEILDVLDRKAPMPEEPDSKAAFAEFQERIHSLAESNMGRATVSPAPVRKRRLGRLLSTIAATVAVLFVLLIGAQAAGVDVFGSLARWTNEVFHLGQSSGESFEIYNMIAKTLIGQEFPSGLVPTWYPEGFKAEEPIVRENSTGKVVMIDFSNDDGQFFTLSFRHYNSPDVATHRTFEKDNMSVETYSVGGKPFYILSNLDERIAVWSDETNTETIQGDLTAAEIKKILDSIGDE